MMVQKAFFIVSILFILLIQNSFAQRGKLLYDSIPKHIPDTVLVYNEFAMHAFFGYDVCTDFVSLRYGFIKSYRGRPGLIHKIGYKFTNHRTGVILSRKYGRNWLDLYYDDLRKCRNESVFKEYLGDLPDSAFEKVKDIVSAGRVTALTPMQLLRYLSNGSRYYSNKIDSERRSIRYEVRRNVNAVISKKDNWVTKADIAELIKYIHSESESCRACQCRDTAVLGQPSTLGLEAFKLISIYRGYTYPTSFETVTPRQVTELFDWWLEERKRK